MSVQTDVAGLQHPCGDHADPHQARVGSVELCVGLLNDEMFHGIHLPGEF